MISRTLHRQLTPDDFRHFFPPGQPHRFSGALVVILEDGTICGFGHQPSTEFNPVAKWWWLTQVADSFVAEAELLSFDAAPMHMWATVENWVNHHTWTITYTPERQNPAAFPVTIWEL
ncbi:MAG: hypothetical protein L0G87_00585 [Renibacterium salmoninarum]|jgi:hypothetical protein|nr:hypothetical protein [Renibacterium salmoninarum]